MPYIKSINLFFSPADSLAGKVLVSTESWAGVGISYATNGYLKVGTTASTFTGQWVSSAGQGWLNSATVKWVRSTQPDHPAGGHDLDRRAGCGRRSKVPRRSCCGGGNWSAYGPWNVINDLADNVWGPTAIPHGEDVPLNPSQFDKAQQGAVSIKFSGQTPFVFCDGHAKSMVPVATDPNMNLQPQNNMWDGLR